MAPITRRPLRPHHLLAFAVSLPERVVRALLGILGGIARLLSWLVPKPVRESRFYKTAVERQIKMMADDFGETGLYKGEPALDKETAVRLGIGGTLDNLLILGLHASPVWILLAAADVAKGAGTFVEDLGHELKEAGVMEEGSRLDSVDDVLVGLSNLSGRLADSLDKPPISLADMKATVAAIKQEAVDVKDTAVNETARINGLANELRELAQKDGKSLMEVTSAVAAGAMRATGNVIVGTAVGATSTLKIVGKRLWSDVLLDYGRSAKRIKRRGFYGALRGFLRPHGRAWQRIFAYRYLTWTEIALSFGKWRKAGWRLQS